MKTKTLCLLIAGALQVLTLSSAQAEQVIPVEIRGEAQKKEKPKATQPEQIKTLDVFTSSALILGKLDLETEEGVTEAEEVLMVRDISKNYEVMKRKASSAATFSVKDHLIYRKSICFESLGAIAAYCDNTAKLAENLSHDTEVRQILASLTKAYQDTVEVLKDYCMERKQVSLAQVKEATASIRDQARFNEMIGKKYLTERAYKLNPEYKD